MNSFEYSFYTDIGNFQMHYDEYLAHDDLRKVVMDKNRKRLFLGLTILSFSEDALNADPNKLKEMLRLQQMQEENPLQFYCPNSDEQLAFINDENGTVFGIVDPNRVGKSSAAFIKLLLDDPPMIETNPNWWIFTRHGIKHREFRGPVNVGIVTYNLHKIEDPIWSEMIKKWTPDWELGIYGRTYAGKGKKYSPSWGHDSQTILKKSKSHLGYYTYEMDQGNFEGGALKKWMWDEQGRQPMWDGADRGLRTTGGHHIHALTPHMVEGRPDTGGAGWLCPLLTGQVTYGHKVKIYASGSIDGVPDWIYPEASKEIEREKWEREPKRIGDRYRLAEGRARLYGEWHTQSGLVLEEWDKKVHIIQPLWDSPARDMTLYRSMDHGQGQAPTVCLWWAVDAEMNIYIYREYYSTHRQISEDVERIVAMSGNTRRVIEHWKDAKSGMIMPMYEETYEQEAFDGTAMDSRSFNLTEKYTMKPYGWLYKMAGLRGFKKASGKHYEHWVPIANQFLLNAKQIEVRKGTPRLYVFDTCPNLIRELGSWIWEVPKAKRGMVAGISKTPGHTDGGTALGYGLQIPIRYLGPHIRHISTTQKCNKEGAIVISSGRQRRRSGGNTVTYRGL